MVATNQVYRQSVLAAYAAKDREVEALCLEVYRYKAKRLSPLEGQAVLDEANNEIVRLRAEITTLREHLAKVCEAGRDLRDTAFCDVIVALDCPRGDCDCCTCDAVGKFDAAIAAAREVGP
jgi:hypothetical protein